MSKRAFPEGRIGNTGMSMRQYYKAAALSMFSYDNWSEKGSNWIAVVSAAIADAMIEEDEKNA